MGLFDFFKKSSDKKVDVDGQEVVNFEELASPVPVEHSNIISEGHDVFSKAMSEVGDAVVASVDEKVEDIAPIEEEKHDIDLSSINGVGEQPVEEEPEVQEVTPVEEVEQEVQEVTTVEEEPSVEVANEINHNDMVVFKECLLAEVKRKKGTRELVTEEDVRNFCHDRMVSFTKGEFQYPEDIRKSMRKYLENQDVINELNGKPKVLQSEEESVKKVA